MWNSRHGRPEPVVALELVVRAGPQREGPQQQVERLADGVGVGVGAEVLDALALAAPHDHGPGPLVVDGHRQERVALVVAQPDVEPGPVPLDQVVLEHERFDVVADLDPLDRLGRGHHLRRARVHVPRVLEVVRQPLAQALGLADVDHPAVGVLELVRAGGVRDRAGGRTLDHTSGYRRQKSFLRLHISESGLDMVAVLPALGRGNGTDLIWGQPRCLWYRGSDRTGR